MHRKHVLLLCLTAAILVSGCTVLQQRATDDAMESSLDTAQEQIQSSCENTKQNACATNGEVTEADYDDACTRDGGHVLDDPYTCN